MADGSATARAQADGDGASMSRVIKLGLGLIMLALALFGVRRELRVHAFVGAAGASCIGNINRLTNPSGFSSTDFSSSTSVVVPSSTGAISLDTNQVPLNPQQIVLPFAQDVDVKYVYRNAGASHMLGWFYYDQLKTGSKPFVITTNGVDSLADWDNDGIPDWFQTAKGTSRPQDGLWHITGSNTVPDLANSGYTYKDQTSFYYGHVPHVLELLSGVANSTVAADHAQDFIFKICDDDTDTASWPSGAGYTPTADVIGSTTVVSTNNPTGTNPDGIPDYDVNNDGIAGNEADRAYDLGTVQGNREIVFFAVTSYSSNLHRAGLGLTGSGSDIQTDSQPWFTKNLLNPDRGGYAPGTVLQKQAIGCSRDDSVCYLAQGATLGWLDATTISRLNTAPYNYLHLDNTVNTIAVGSDGSVPHFVVNAPSTDPNRWIMALDDQPEYPGASDSDYNDVVFLIERTNGGLVVSQNQVKSTDIPTGSTANDYMISKIRLRFSATYPLPGCTAAANANIQFYWSVDNVNWYPAGFPTAATSGDITIDVLSLGIIGHQVYWKANFISSSQYCQPVLNSMNVGYEALQHGEYKFDSPVPAANVVFSGSLETSSSQWTVTRNDYRSRGHFYSSQLFNPTTLQDSSIVNWDSGTVMNSTASSLRQGIFTNVNGLSLLWNATNGSAGAAPTLYGKILSANDRTAKANGALIFDFNGDGLTNDLDAAYVMEWTRGLEYPQNPPTGSTTTTERAWKLGAIHNSSPAIIGTPGHPPWLDGTNAALGTFKNAYNGTSWLGDVNGVMKRRTVAIIGAQDGMLHGFDAGNFHNSNELVCATQQTRLVRGCFAPDNTGGPPDYGTGKEIFAYIPPTLINAMKNNVGPVFGNPTYPEAEVDGSVAVDDVYYQPTTPVTGNPKNTFVTAAFASLGQQWNYITAIGWTTMNYSGTTPVSTLPFPLWTNDWTDPDYRGSGMSPATGVATTPNGTRWIVMTNSGLAQAATEGTIDEYAFVIDASNGTTITNGKIALDVANPPLAYGFASSPNLVDSDGDGINDRAYMVDTSGRIFRVNLGNLTKCQIGSTGEPVFSGMAINVLSPSKVQLFLGGGANPDGSNLPATPSTLHIFALEDDDPASGATCTAATVVYKYATPGNQSTWATPFVAGTSVYVATSSSTEEGVCATGAGQLIGLSTTGNNATTNPQPSSVTTPVPLNNAAASSISVYDGHVFLNGIAQETAVIGASNSWNNLPSGAGTGSGVTLGTLHWTEQ